MRKEHLADCLGEVIQTARKSAELTQTQLAGYTFRYTYSKTNQFQGGTYACGRFARRRGRVRQGNFQKGG